MASSLQDSPPELSSDTLDAITELTHILARLRSGITSSTGGITKATTAAPPPSLPRVVSSASDNLQLKDVTVKIDELKHKLKKGRAQIGSLEDVQRRIDSQEKDIKELEGRISLQKEVLEMVRKAGAVDVPMRGA